MIDTLRGAAQQEGAAMAVAELLDRRRTTRRLWEATGCEKYLRIGSRVGDYISSDTVQIADGSIGRTAFTTQR